MHPELKSVESKKGREKSLGWVRESHPRSFFGFIHPAPELSLEKFLYLENKPCKKIADTPSRCTYHVRISPK